MDHTFILIGQHLYYSPRILFGTLLPLGGADIRSVQSRSREREARTAVDRVAVVTLQF